MNFVKLRRSLRAATKLINKAAAKARRTPPKTQKQWQALLVRRLMEHGVPKAQAWRRVRKHITKLAVSNLNVMEKIKASQPLVDAAVVKLCWK